MVNVLSIRCAGFLACVLLMTLFALAPVVQGATYYVKTNGNDAAAGTTWATAKQTIQAAVDIAADGDDVWVTNGLYQTGTRITPGSTNGTLNRRIKIQYPETSPGLRPQSVRWCGPGKYPGRHLGCHR